jgi:hypothetical protein
LDTNLRLGFESAVQAKVLPAGELLRRNRREIHAQDTAEFARDQSAKMTQNWPSGRGAVMFSQTPSTFEVRAFEVRVVCAQPCSE